jgi:hypothetical protein
MCSRALIDSSHPQQGRFKASFKSHRIESNRFIPSRPHTNATHRIATQPDHTHEYVFHDHARTRLSFHSESSDTNARMTRRASVQDSPCALCARVRVLIVYHPHTPRCRVVSPASDVIECVYTHAACPEATRIPNSRAHLMPLTLVCPCCCSGRHAQAPYR